jgi:hypothetical protein
LTIILRISRIISGISSGTGKPSEFAQNLQQNCAKEGGGVVMLL